MYALERPPGKRRPAFKVLLALLDEVLVVSVIIVGALMLGLMDMLPLPLTAAVIGIALGAMALLAYRVATSTPLDYAYVPIGERAVVVDPLGPMGVVVVRGEYWRAVCMGCTAGRGETVIVVGIDGNTLYVKKV